MPCIKIEHTGIVAITMPSSPALGTPIYHFNVVRVSQKIWDELSPKLRQLYKTKMLFAQPNSSPNKVSYIQLLLILSGGQYEPFLLKSSITERERGFADLGSYEEKILIDTFMNFNHKNPKKVKWVLKNICI